MNDTASTRVHRFVWLDGRLVAIDRARLSVSDRGFQLGDGIFESLRARRGIVLELDEHLARLHESAAATAIPLPPDGDLVAGLHELLSAEGLAEPGLAGDGGDTAAADDRKQPGPPGDAALRITVSRGALEGRGLLPPDWQSAAPTVAIEAWPYAPPSPVLLECGVSAILSSVRHDPSSPLAGIKSTSRADHVFAKLEAVRAGADDAIFGTIDGHLSEATTANVFLVFGDRLATPPLSAGILAGTTRTWILARSATGELTACGRRLALEERDLVPADLLAADEAFLSSSVAGILPLTRFEGRPIGNGRPGAITLALRAQRDAWFDEAALLAIRSGRAAAARTAQDGEDPAAARGGRARLHSGA